LLELHVGVNTIIITYSQI